MLLNGRVGSSGFQKYGHGPVGGLLHRVRHEDLAVSVLFARMVKVKLREPARLVSTVKKSPVPGASRCGSSRALWPRFFADTLAAGLWIRIAAAGVGLSVRLAIRTLTICPDNRQGTSYIRSLIGWSILGPAPDDGEINEYTCG